ncbi:MAG: hypothetical protein KME06_04815 [Kastovskya adunca ATA6-11-RM4]|jgi:hypothetical protein|nr:hypothetical protein [Kastovskya adunca ATA6-11-RM4]
MTDNFLSDLTCAVQLQQGSQKHWHSFEEIVQRLHGEGIYIHPEQLAEFYLAHGLPVHLRYVPNHLKAKAAKLNENYQGDMAALTEEEDYPPF